MKSIARLILTFVLLQTSFAWAEKPLVFKVQKVKDHRAIILFPKSKTIEPGQIYKVNLISNLSEAELEPMGGNADRSRSIAFDMSIDFTTTNSGGTKSEADSIILDLNYGFNNETIEYGPLFRYSFTKLKTTDSMVLGLGAFIDFNFEPNTGNRASIWGVRLAGLTGLQDNSGLKKANSTFETNGSLFYKWFGLDANMALVGQIGYGLASVTSSGTKTDQNRLFSNVGIQTYF